MRGSRVFRAVLIGRISCVGPSHPMRGLRTVPEEEGDTGSETREGVEYDENISFVPKISLAE